MDLVHNRILAGELSPDMNGAADLPQYYQGARLLENMVIKQTGGAYRRPGFEDIAAAKSSAYAGRLVGFVNQSTRYVLWFGDQVMRVFKRTGDAGGTATAVTSGGGVYELATPWHDTDLDGLVFAARGQAISHPSYDLYELTCSGDASWTLTAFSSQYGPFLDKNKTTTTLAVSATSGTGKTMTASAALFAVTHVGALFELTHLVDEASLTANFTNTAVAPYTQNATSSTVTLKGRCNITIHWHGWGKLKLQRSEDGSTWNTIKTWDKPNDEGNFALTDVWEELEDNVSFRFYIDWASLGNPDTLYDGSIVKWLIWSFDPPHLIATIAAQNMTQTGIVRVTAFSSSTSVTVSVLNALGSTGATDNWREGAWSGYRGYPAVCGIHDSRIWAACTTHQPTTAWAGRPFLKRSDARVFYAGTDVTADDAISRTIDNKDCNAIQWLESMWVMLVGTDGNLLKGVGANENSPMTPTDANFWPQSGVGSSSLQPEKIAGHLVYAGRSSKRVYEMTYSDDTRVYNPEDLTRWAEHITRDGIVGWTFMQQPYPILWAVTSDGYLIGLTRDRQQDMLAWHRHSTDGTFEGRPVVIPSDTDDELWVTVCRTVNGATRRSIERMRPFDYDCEQRDCFYVDDGTTWDGGAAATITGIAVAAGTGRVTVTAANSLVDGYTVKLEAVGGMTEVNGKVYTVADRAAGSFTLKTRDGSAYVVGTAFTAYTSGGTAERVTNSVTGLTQLAGETVSVLLDGQPTTGTVTAGGVYTVGSGKDRYYHNTITVGRDYDYALSPMRPEVRTVSGSAQAKRKKVTYVGARLYRSAGGKIGTDENDAVDIDYSNRGDLANAETVLVTDDENIDHPGGWQEHGDIWIGGNGPLPFNITSILFGME
jgi:hypothetical protein